MKKQEVCFICGHHQINLQGTYLKCLEPKIQEKLKCEYPTLTDNDFICFDDLLNLKLNFNKSEQEEVCLETNKIEQNTLQPNKDHSAISKETSSLNKQGTSGEKVSGGASKDSVDWATLFKWLLYIIIVLYVVYLLLMINMVLHFGNEPWY